MRARSSKARPPSSRRPTKTSDPLTVTVGILSALVLAISLRDWSRQVPVQNLVLAEFQILAAAVALSWMLQSPVTPWSWTTLSGWSVAAATIPAARQVAARLCQRLHPSPRYGYWLNLVAACLASVPVGLAFQPPPRQASTLDAIPLRLWLTALVWCLLVYLLTLPCWLDKRKAGMRPMLQ